MTKNHVTLEELINEDETPIVYLKDGALGLLLVYPINKPLEEQQCGVQVRGEEEHRWIPITKLFRDKESILSLREHD